VLGAVTWLLAAALILGGYRVVGWVLAVPIALMVALDFCAVVFSWRAARRGGRPAERLRHGRQPGSSADL
jgi:membrane protein implicated in regulation of membrane protease activity